MINKTFLFLLCMLFAFLPALGGLAAGADVLQNWYALLNKPPFTPPNWLFGPAWGALYLLCGVILYILAVSKINAEDKKTLLLYFCAQAALNFLWTPVFFGMRAVFFSLCIIILMAALCVDFVRKALSVKPVLAYLFYPYIAWLLYAGYLNAGVCLLN